MSEWLTTGEMIDRLKVGEKALCQEFRSWLIKNTEEEGILWEDGSKFYISNEMIRKTKWCILPKYVTFEEAMKALKDGKYARIHLGDGFIHFSQYDTEPESLSFKEMYEGKWQIIE